MSDRIRVFRNDDPNGAYRNGQDSRFVQHSLLAEEVAEVALLLPLRHCVVLESESIRQGVTMGQLLRRLVAASVADLEREAIFSNGGCPSSPRDTSQVGSLEDGGSGSRAHPGAAGAPDESRSGEPSPRRTPGCDFLSKPVPEQKKSSRRDEKGKPP